MRTEKEVKAEIRRIKKDNSHVLDGSLSTVVENAPRALMQLSAAARLQVLHWVLEKEYTVPWRKK
jgi:hypothetical protein